MILADTSVWIDHIRRNDLRMRALLEERSILMHPHVLGEIALGNLRNRAEVLEFLQGLPQLIVADDAEVLLLIDRQALEGSGIGYVDAHLLASIKLVAGSKLWTRDKQLARVAVRMAVAADH